MSERKALTHRQILQLAEYALLSAIVVIMTITPLGYIPIGPISLTLCHLPMILGAVLLGWQGGAVIGAVWGFTCVALAYIRPPSILDGILFTNAFVSILPRILAGLIAGLLFYAVSKLGGKHANKTEKESRKLIATGVAAVSGTLANTLLVLGTIYFIYGTKHGAELGITGPISAGGLTEWLPAMAGLNAPVEIIAAVIVTIPISYGVRRAVKRF
jgi:uncharacterized membrane protein